jgi:hypothetical protein
LLRDDDFRREIRPPGGFRLADLGGFGDLTEFRSALLDFASVDLTGKSTVGVFLFAGSVLADRPAPILSSALRRRSRPLGEPGSLSKLGSIRRFFLFRSTMPNNIYWKQAASWPCAMS